MTEVDALPAEPISRTENSQSWGLFKGLGFPVRKGIPAGRRRSSHGERLSTFSSSWRVGRSGTNVQRFRLTLALGISCVEVRTFFGSFFFLFGAGGGGRLGIMPTLVPTWKFESCCASYLSFLMMRTPVLDGWVGGELLRLRHCA